MDVVLYTGRGKLPLILNGLKTNVASGKGYHTTHDKSNNANNIFQINYKTLSHPERTDSSFFKRLLPPDTVQSNVKNVQGHRGSAVRGFLAVYPDLVHDLSRELAGEQQQDRGDVINWVRKVLTHNLSSSTLGSSRSGLLVPVAYRHLHKTASKEMMNMAHKLGWSVELVRAFKSISKSCMGLDKGTPPPPWSVKHGLDPGKSFNDVLLVQNAVYALLDHYFGHAANYPHYVRSVQESLQLSYIGNLLSFKNHPSRKGTGHTIQIYKNLVKCNVADATYCLPVSLALHMAGISDKKVSFTSRSNYEGVNEPKWRPHFPVHRHAKAIFNDVGYFSEVSRDHTNNFINIDLGLDDISRGKVTWLSVIATQRANSSQRTILEKFYGTGNEEDAKKVHSLYDDLNLGRTIKVHLEEKQGDIMQMIQQISKLDKHGLSQEFVFRLIDSLDYELNTNGGGMVNDDP